MRGARTRQFRPLGAAERVARLAEDLDGLGVDRMPAAERARLRAALCQVRRSAADLIDRLTARPPAR